MGQVYNGKYELFEYLVNAYYFNPYKTLTTRQKPNEYVNHVFKHVDLKVFTQAELANDLVTIRSFNGDQYGKRFSDIPSELSVCICNYEEYKILSKEVATVGFVINQNLTSRYQLNLQCDRYSPTTFLKYNEDNESTSQAMKDDPHLIHFDGETLTQLKLQFDDYMKPYLKYLPRDIKHTKR